MSVAAGEEVEGVESASRPDAEVRGVLRPLLPKNFFRRSPSRILYAFAGHAAMAAHLYATAAWLDGQISGGWVLLSLIAASYTFPFFLFTLHELGHGALFPPGILRNICGAIAGFWLFFQPTFWQVSHAHHHATTNTEEDTDRLRFFSDHVPWARFVAFNWKNFLTPLSFVFTIQIIYTFCMVGLLTGLVPYRYSRIRGALLLLAQVAIYGALFYLLGAKLLLWGVLPVMVIGGALQGMYLITNHLTRPFSEVLDVLGTTLSVHCVRGHSQMDFGRHAEHHLFPSVSMNKLRPVTLLLREHFAGRFREMHIVPATLRRLRLPGYYFSPTVLTDRSGRLRVQID